MRAKQSSSSFPKKISRYEILAEIGRGGMATVYLAQDPNFNRKVAIKVLPHEALEDETLYERFKREAQIIASLEHPAIIPVHDFGEENGQPFLVMRYLSGGSLASRLKTGPLSIQETIKVLQQIGGALDTAHKKGIVHRDIKPGNILFDQNGDAFLSDFGIAQLSGIAGNLTGTSLLGTPAYMSPEQVRGGAKIDGRSDNYALGVVVFEMLTGYQPYKADTPSQQMMMHITNPTPRLAEYRQGLPTELDNILIRAMAKDPELRYQQVSDFAKDMIQARSSRSTEGIEQTALTYDVLDIGNASDAGGVSRREKSNVNGSSRKRFLWVFTVCVSLCLCLGLIGGVLAVANRKTLVAFFSHASTTPSIFPTPKKTALDLLEIPQLVPTESVSSATISQATPTGTPPGNSFIFNAKGNLEAFAFSRDGTKLATGGLGDGGIRIWRTQDWSLETILRGHSDKVEFLSWSPKGNVLVSIGKDGKALVWDMDKEVIRQQITGINFISAVKMKWSMDGELFGIASSSELYYFRNFNFSQVSKLICDLMQCLVTSFDFSPNSSAILTGFSSPTNGAWIGFWDVITGKLEKKLTNADVYDFGDIAYSPDGNSIAVVGAKSNPYSAQAWVWDLSSNLVTIPATQPRQGSRADYVFWMKDGVDFITCDNVGTVMIWDAVTGETKAIYSENDIVQGEDNPAVSDVVMLPGGDYLAIGFYSGEIVKWKIPEG